MDDTEKASLQTGRHKKLNHPPSQSNDPSGLTGKKEIGLVRLRGYRLETNIAWEIYLSNIFLEKLT